MSRKVEVGRSAGLTQPNELQSRSRQSAALTRLNESQSESERKRGVTPCMGSQVTAVQIVSNAFKRLGGDTTSKTQG